MELATLVKEVEDAAVLDDPSKMKSLGESARKRIEEVFDWKIVGKQYQELFGEISK